MDEFARLMSMEGVRPLDQPTQKSGRPAKQAHPVSNQAIVAPPEPGPGGHAWVTGPARALRSRRRLSGLPPRSAMDGAAGRPAFARTARPVTLPASSGAAALLGTADRQSLRLMLVGGDGWTFVMHPLMGVATLDEDPAGSV
jgi:hypothetical protein